MTISSVTPGALIDPDWGNDVADAINSLAYSSATYTPTLSGAVIGTGGSPINTAKYVFVGGPDVGDVGLLNVHGRIVFGTSGQTFPTSPTLTLPSGFQVDTTTFPSTGHGRATYTDTSAGTIYAGLTRMSSATAVRLLRLAETESFPSTTTPFTWASSDTITWSMTVQVVRV